MLLAAVCKRMQQLCNFASKLGRASSQFLGRISATGIHSASLVSLPFFFGIGAGLFVAVS